jgi:predicted Zn-dependent peptidase
MNTPPPAAETTFMAPVHASALPPRYEMLGAVTAAEIQAVAQKYLDPDRAHIVAVGDAARIRSALAKLGAVES